jgi:hypothetical protein
MGKFRKAWIIVMLLAIPTVSASIIIDAEPKWLIDTEYKFNVKFINETIYDSNITLNIEDYFKIEEIKELSIGNYSIELSMSDETPLGNHTMIIFSNIENVTYTFRIYEIPLQDLNESEGNETRNITGEPTERFWDNLEVFDWLLIGATTLFVLFSIIVFGLIIEERRKAKK